MEIYSAVTLVSFVIISSIDMNTTNKCNSETESWNQCWCETTWLSIHCAVGSVERKRKLLQKIHQQKFTDAISAETTATVDDFVSSTFGVSDFTTSINRFCSVWECTYYNKAKISTFFTSGHTFSNKWMLKHR